MAGEFTYIKALVLLNVVSGKTFIERGAENLMLDSSRVPSERLRDQAPEFARCPCDKRNLL
jgi:hypothetical protein